MVLSVYKIYQYMYRETQGGGERKTNVDIAQT